MEVCDYQINKSECLKVHNLFNNTPQNCDFMDCSLINLLSFVASLKDTEVLKNILDMLDMSHLLEVCFLRKDEKFLCPCLGYVFIPCSVKNCDQWIDLSDFLNCGLCLHEKMSGKQGELGLGILAYILKKDIKYTKKTLDSALKKMWKTELYKEIDPEFEVYHMDGFCVNCEKKLSFDNAFRVEGLVYCSQDCYLEKPPIALNLEKYLGVSFNTLVDVILKRFKGLALVSKVLGCEDISIIGEKWKWYILNNIQPSLNNNQLLSRNYTRSGDLLLDLKNKYETHRCLYEKCDNTKSVRLQQLYKIENTARNILAVERCDHCKKNVDCKQLINNHNRMCNEFECKTNLRRILDERYDRKNV